VVDQYLGEIKLLGFNFAPIGWALCQGQTLSITQYAALYSLLGTSYGGNGQTTFQLPDLQGRAAGHVGPNLYTAQGLKLGTETVTIQLPQYPAHTHPVAVNATTATQNSAVSAYLATATQFPPASPPPPPVPNIYTPASGATLVPLNTAGTPVLAPYGGGNQPHENMMPFLVMNYSIAMTGVFPARS